MPTLRELIEDKNKRITSVPDRFISQAAKSEKEILAGILELLSRLKVKDGKFVSSRANLQIAAEINDQLKSILLASEYTEAVTDFIAQFDQQGVSNLKYFKAAFDVTALPKLATAAIDRAKRNTIDLLLNTGADADFLKPLGEVIENSVITGAGFKDTLQTIQLFVTGDSEQDSKLLSHSKQIAHDAFAITDREITSIVSDELEAEWFFYSGDTIPGSREFCIERHNQYFYYKEIEAWTETTWAGMIEGTNAANIYTYAGGYNCGHSIMPVSIFTVPLEVIQRNIANGNFTPSKFEVEELGL